MPMPEKDGHAAIGAPIARDEVPSKIMGVASRTPPRNEDGARSAGNRDNSTGETASEGMTATECAVMLTRGPATTEAMVRETDVAGPLTTIESGTPFVVINTAVKIPAQLLAKAHVRADEKRGQQTIVADGTLEVPTTKTTTDATTASAVTTTNEWG